MQLFYLQAIQGGQVPTLAEYEKKYGKLPPEIREKFTNVKQGLFVLLLQKIVTSFFADWSSKDKGPIIPHILLYLAFSVIIN